MPVLAKAPLSALLAGYLALTAIAIAAPSYSLSAQTDGRAEFQPIETTLGYCGEWALNERGYQLADALLSTALACHIGNPDHDLGYAYFSRRLARTLLEEEKPQAALKWFKKCLTIDENAYGKNSYFVLREAAFLADELQDLGHPSEARILAERALQNLPPSDGLMPSIHITLSSIYAGLGLFRASEAEAATAQSQGGLSAIEKGVLLSNLACAQAKRGRFDESALLYGQVNDAMKDSVPPVWLTNNAVCIAIVTERAGKHYQVDELEKKSIGMIKELSAKRFDYVSDFARNAGSLCMLKGNYKDAEWLLQKARESAERSCGAREPLTLFAMHKQAELYLAQGRLAEAEALAADVLALREEVLGSDNVETSNTQQLLGQILEKRQHLDQAAQLFEKALRIRESELGTGEPITTETRARLHYALEAQQRQSYRATQTGS